MENNKIDLKNIIMVGLAVALAFLLKLKYIDWKENISFFSPKDNSIKEITDANNSVQETHKEEQPVAKSESSNENNEEVLKVAEEAPDFKDAKTKDQLKQRKNVPI